MNESQENKEKIESQQSLESLLLDMPKTPVNKVSKFRELLNSSYSKTVITLMLLAFLFITTFVIAYKTRQQSFRTSSANIKIVPEAKINVPEDFSPSTESGNLNN